MDATTLDESRPVVRIEMLGSFRVVVEGQPVADSAWSRRQAAELVKLLALAEGRRLHREQVIDALWPEDRLDEATPKFHKASHFARRAVGVPDAIVVRGEQVTLCPHATVEIDAAQFDDLARSALANGDRRAAATAIDSYGGDLLPGDLYAEWAEAHREHLRLRFLDLLRLDERWERLIEIDPGDEEAHLALMRRYASNGDRHAALRQYERLDRHLRHELGVSPSRAASALRDELLAARVPARADSDLIGRSEELALIDRLVEECAGGASRIVLVHGRAGMGKSMLLRHATGLAKRAGFRLARGVSSAVEGGWPFALVVDALADLCRQQPALLDGLAEGHRREFDRALDGADEHWSGESSHQRLFVAAAELVRLASATSGLLLVLDDVHDSDDASLRLLHYIARTTPDHRTLVVIGHRSPFDHPTLAEIRASLIDRHAAVDLPLKALEDEDASELVRRHGADLDDHVVAQIVEAADGVPFVLAALARRANEHPNGLLSPEPPLLSGTDAATRQALQRVALVGTSFDTDDFVALAGLPEPDAFEALDNALELGLLEPSSGGYRFRHELVREALIRDIPPHRARAIHRDTASRLIVADAAPARIGRHLLAAGAPTEAVPYLLRAAETHAATGAYRDALSLIEEVRPHVVGEARAQALLLRGDLLNAIGDPMAVSAYREALDGAGPDFVRKLRARLARSAVMSGDLSTAANALDGLEPDGGDDDAEILLAHGNYAFFVGDFDKAGEVADAAERLIFGGQPNWKVLDLVALQGLLAHRSGTWYDRIRLELKRTRTQPDVANAVFDGHLCATEYVLYGHTPYHEVIAVGGDLKRTAQRSGALRAEAFAAALVGEAALLSGDLGLAEAELVDAADLHRDLGSAGGEAVALLRLAEVAIARGDKPAALELLERALPLGRDSMIANHLMERIFGAMILAAPDVRQARVAVDRAEATLGWDEKCPFCAIMLAVPATIACARAGDLEHAGLHLTIAELSAAMWEGTSWKAALEEAHAAVALARGEPGEATSHLSAAVVGFERAGQPIDVERCRKALVALG